MYNNYNPYFGQQPMQRYQPVETQQYVPPMPINKPVGLLGKSVDSVDVVKAADIPLDGSISYFPLTDGSAIVTKQLQNNGTSKTVVYKPVDSVEEEKQKFITVNELNQAIENINVSELKEELKGLKKQIKEIKFELKDKDE